MQERTTFVLRSDEIAVAVREYLIRQGKMSKEMANRARTCTIHGVQRHSDGSYQEFNYFHDL